MIKINYAWITILLLLIIYVSLFDPYNVREWSKKHRVYLFVGILLICFIFVFPNILDYFCSNKYLVIWSNYYGNSSGSILTLVGTLYAVFSSRKGTKNQIARSNRRFQKRMIRSDNNLKRQITYSKINANKQLEAYRKYSLNNEVYEYNNRKLDKIRKFIFYRSLESDHVDTDVYSYGKVQYQVLNNLKSFLQNTLKPISYFSLELILISNSLNSISNDNKDKEKKYNNKRLRLFRLIGNRLSDIDKQRSVNNWPSINSDEFIYKYKIIMKRISRDLWNIHCEIGEIQMVNIWSETD